MHKGTCVCEGLPMHPSHRPCRLSDSLRTGVRRTGAPRPPSQHQALGGQAPPPRLPIDPPG
eukprot:998263-Prorocentrum_minimum.AAC.1